MAKRIIPNTRRNTLIPPFPKRRSILPVDFSTKYTNNKLTSLLKKINDLKNILKSGQILMYGYNDENLPDNINVKEK